jgi:uncharacterized membrane protein YgaE (UPF0421/DUF939 family)
LKNTKQLKKQMENKTVLIWKMGAASAISWELAKLAGSHHPYLAPLSVVLCLQTTINRSILFSYHRMVGTVIGISVVVLIEPYIKVSGWTLGLLMILGSFITKWLKRDETAIHQVALTVLLVFVMGEKSGDYPMDRFRDTLIGAIVAVILQMIVHPPNYTKDTSKNIQRLTSRITETFQQVSNWIQSGLNKASGNELQNELKRLLQELHQAKKLIQDAKESLKYNILAKKSESELQKCEKRLYDLTLAHTYLVNIVGALTAWSVEENITSYYQDLWCDQIKNLSLFFQAKENNSAAGDSTGEILLIELPKELEKLQYHAAMCFETNTFLKKMNEKPDLQG